MTLTARAAMPTLSLISSLMLLLPLTINWTSAATTICDSSRLIRCQQDALRDMQQMGQFNSAANIVQYPLSGPPYSPGISQKQQLLASGTSTTTCRLVRSNLDCLLQTTPSCYDMGIQAAQNTDIILRAKRYLEQNACNDPDTTWQSTFCYRSPEIRSCEERYGFTSYASSAASLLGSANNLTACLAYQAFKYCTESHLRLNCKVHEMDMANEYLIDRASDLAWRCPVNISSQVTSSHSHFGDLLQLQRQQQPYALNNQPGGALLSPIGGGVSHYSNYDASIQQRPIPSYVGSTGNLNLFSSSNTQRNTEQAWERFRNPSSFGDDSVARYGISRYPNSGGSEVFDRLVAGNSFDAVDSTDCPVKAAPYARECEDTLMDQQRLARDSRDGNELQRRICCSLFQYRDCISRVVLDRCADSSPTAVEILMGVRRREMTLTCRGFNRDICSGSLAQTVLSLPLLLILAALTSFMTLKPRASM